MWVGGDFHGTDWTVTNAIGSGKRAAVAIDLELNGNKAADESLLFGPNYSISLQSYLSDGSTKPYERSEPVEYDELNLAYHQLSKRLKQHETEPDVRIRDFSEIVADLGLRSINREATRCFHCGTCDSCGNCHIFCPDGAVRRDPVTLELSFDLEHCKGCGVCEAECPRAAIEMRK